VYLRTISKISSQQQTVVAFMASASDHQSTIRPSPNLLSISSVC